MKISDMVVSYQDLLNNWIDYNTGGPCGKPKDLGR
jgi:hypothetical protein